MISLKVYSASLANYLNITPIAVYERQRALVRLGVLPAERRGPNKGVRATPDAVAPLLLTGLFADGLSDIDDRFVRLLRAKPTEFERRLQAHADQQAHVESAARQFAVLGRKFERPVMPAPGKINCPITEAGNFRDAVAALLAESSLAAQVDALSINRSALVGVISATDGRISQFGAAKSTKPRLEVVAHFPGDLIRKMAAEIAAIEECS